MTTEQKTPPRMIEAQFEHGDWARNQLLAACDELSDAALDRPFEMGPGSLRKSLRHLWEAERIWQNRWSGKADPNNVTSDEAIAPAALRQLHDETATERVAFVRGLSAGELDQPFTYQNMRGDSFSFPIGDLMAHVCNHGVHHRAQALNMLRHVGGELPRMDFLVYRGVMPEVATPAYDVARLRRYFAYGDWATHVVRELAETLPEAKQDRQFEMGLGSLRKTLLHLYDAEKWWLGNWNGNPADGFPEIPNDTQLETLRDLWATLAEQRNAIVDAAT